jgi:hypothetical protein
MKHAGEEALDTLEGLLQQVRKHKSLTEKKRGVFYSKSAAFLYFHEDAAGLFADLRVGKDWKRLPVGTKKQQQLLLSELASVK